MKVIILLVCFITMMNAFASSDACDPKEYFHTIAVEVQHYKNQVQDCYQNTNQFDRCQGGMCGIDDDILQPTGNIASLRTSYGVITVFPVPCGAIVSEDTYIQTPYFTESGLKWASSGLSVLKGYID